MPGDEDDLEPGHDGMLMRSLRRVPTEVVRLSEVAAAISDIPAARDPVKPTAWIAESAARA